MSCTYYEGDTVTLQATFHDIAGELVDPSTVTLTVENPSAVITSPVPSNPSVGVYRAQVPLTEPGWWSYRWEGQTTEGTKVCEGTLCPCASSISGGS